MSTTASNPYAGLIEPCPFCGSSDVETDCMSRNKDNLCDEPAVCCNSCKSITVFDIVTAKPHEDVVPLWNARPVLSRLTRDVEEAREALERAGKFLRWIADGDSLVMAKTLIDEADAVDATLTRLSRMDIKDLDGADPAFVASQSSPSVSTKGFNRGERKGDER